MQVPRSIGKSEVRPDLYSTMMMTLAKNNLQYLTFLPLFFDLSAAGNVLVAPLTLDDTLVETLNFASLLFVVGDDWTTHSTNSFDRRSQTSIEVGTRL